MDIKEYIASGIIESYALGTASEQEQREVRCMAAIYPEIETELRTYEKKITHLADANAIPPPDALKQKVLDALFETIEKDLKGTTEDNVVSISKNPEVIGRKNSWKIAAAASFVLFIIASSVFINSRSNYNTLQAELEQKEAEYELELAKAANKLESLDHSINTFENQLAFLSNKQTKQVALSGTDKSEGSDVRVYWNANNNKVVLKVNQLPQTPAAKQYQLWAIIDGVPTDMGMLPISDFGNQLIEMPNKAKNPIAFAITLEDEGGKPEPNLEELYVIGNV